MRKRQANRGRIISLDISLVIPVDVSLKCTTYIPAELMCPFMATVFLNGCVLFQPCHSTKCVQEWF